MKNPFQFIEEVRQETSKVTWPSWKEVWITTAMVLVMVALTAVFFLFTDMIISYLVQFVLGLKNALPARRELLEFLVRELEAVLPGSTWTAAGMAKNQLVVNHWALELGGHARTGLEDNLRFDEHRLAASNAELVARVAALTKQYGRPVATPAQARVMLGLEAA